MLVRSFAAAAARLVFAASALFAFSAAAEAQLITYVAATGNDASPCTVATAPCRTLQRAYTATSPNGTMRVLTPIQGSLFIAKNITVEGNGATIVGVIIIANPSAVVTLRGLALNGGKVFVDGIRIDSAAAVSIEDSTVERYKSDAIQLATTAATKLFILDTVARTSSDGLYAEAPNAQVVIQDSHFDQNFSSGAFIKVAKFSVVGGSASGNAANGFVMFSSGTITGTSADNNVEHGFSIRNGSTVHLASAKASGNGASGLHTESGSAFNTAFVTDSVFIGTVSAPGVVNGSLMSSRGNNTAAFTQGNLPSEWDGF